MANKRTDLGRHLSFTMAPARQVVPPFDATAGEPAGLAESSCISRAQRGDVDAFEEIYVAHAGRVHALCLRLTGDRASARELTQDVFVKAWEALPAFRGEASVTTWLHRIAVNALLMQRRADARRTMRVSLAEDDVATGPASEGGSAPVDVATAIDLERAVAALPPGVRRAFVLHDVEGYSHEEIAHMTGLAPGTLRAQLHRARQLLMKAMSP